MSDRDEDDSAVKAFIAAGHTPSREESGDVHIADFGNFCGGPVCTRCGDVFCIWCDPRGERLEKCNATVEAGGR